jgi:hypothetical protein
VNAQRQTATQAAQEEEEPVDAVGLDLAMTTVHARRVQVKCGVHLDRSELSAAPFPSNRVLLFSLRRFNCFYICSAIDLRCASLVSLLYIEASSSLSSLTTTPYFCPSCRAP